jgi:hypothetical protein
VGIKEFVFLSIILNICGCQLQETTAKNEKNSYGVKVDKGIIKRVEIDAIESNVHLELLKQSA